MRSWLAGAAEVEGRILVPEVGEQTRIVDLAKSLIGAADGNPDRVYRVPSRRQTHRRACFEIRDERRNH